MRMLLVKMSSLGDVVHTFPAITDALRARPGLRIDWVVERAYADLPALHPGVGRVIPIDLRAWRHALWQSRSEMRTFAGELRSQRYDLILDAQGLIKSGAVTRLAKGTLRAGPDRVSAREGAASWCYERRIEVPVQRHAIERLRILFAAALNYRVPDVAATPDYGLKLPDIAHPHPVATPPITTRSDATTPDGVADASLRKSSEPTLVFLHGTSWSSKQWPEAFWRRLAGAAVAAGFRVLLPWGTRLERHRSMGIAEGVSGCTVPPAQSLPQLSAILVGAAGVVTVDTGLGHLAAALAVPTVALYGPTDSELTGLKGRNVVNLNAGFACAPCRDRACRYRGPDVLVAQERVIPACFSSVPPERVWRALDTAIRDADSGSRPVTVEWPSPGSGAGPGI